LLRSLNLWQAAPDLLVSSASPQETLARLRATGYAPVEEGRDGEVVVERRAVRRLAAPELEPDGMLDDGVAWLGDALAVMPMTDPLDLADQLLDGPLPAKRKPRPTRAEKEEIDYLERLFTME
jgi:hypothetical protein